LYYHHRKRNYVAIYSPADGFAVVMTGWMIFVLVKEIRIHQ
jgi:uncharacterized protein YlbG (UPF0298 family)